MNELQRKEFMLEVSKKDKYITKVLTINDLIIPKCGFEDDEVFVKYGNEGRYGVSNKGNIYGEHRKKLLILDKSSVYIRIGIFYGKTQVNEALHRLMSICFIDNPNNYPYIHHKDRNKRNNILSNFEWTTNQINQQESVKNNGARVSLSNEEAVDIFILSNRVKNSRCVKIGKAFNVNRNSIIELRAGRSRGYITKDIILKDYNKDDILNILKKYNLEPSNII